MEAFQSVRDRIRCLIIESELIDGRRVDP
jgi:hypothetical protein